jgi:hypothetical protein
MYDIFYVSQTDKNKNQLWQEFKSQYPSTKYVTTFRDAQKKSLTRFFWIVWDNLIVDKNFKFDYKPDQWSNNYIHVFKNDNLYNGILLCPKKIVVSKKEIEHRFFVNKKEIDVVASTPKPYDVFEIDSYDEYLSALENSTTELFWMSSKNITATIPDIYFDYSNTYDRKQNHAFIHQVGDEDLYNGVFLCSKYKLLSKKEVEHRHPVDRKEWDVVASTPKPYDVVFISYQEPNADENYQKLLDKCSSAKRIHGIKGIHQAHIAAAELCKTDMFWIVDGDAVLLDDFDFDYQVTRWDQETVHVWRSQNPINGLIYGYGGVKLFPKQLTINMDISKPDMTTSISNKFKAVQEVSNITAFNTDPFNTWKSAFRECVKLSSRIIDRQKDDETQRRLQVWCTVGADQIYGKYALDGAKMGALYGARNQNNKEKLKMINDFDWLKEQFDARNI